MTKEIFKPGAACTLWGDTAYLRGEKGWYHYDRFHHEIRLSTLDDEQVDEGYFCAEVTNDLRVDVNRIEEGALFVSRDNSAILYRKKKQGWVVVDFSAVGNIVKALKSTGISDLDQLEEVTPSEIPDHVGRVEVGESYCSVYGVTDSATGAVRISVDPCNLISEFDQVPYAYIANDAGVYCRIPDEGWRYAATTEGCGVIGTTGPALSDGVNFYK